MSPSKSVAVAASLACCATAVLAPAAAAQGSVTQDSVTQGSVPVSFACRAKPPLLPAQEFVQQSSITADAPASVAPGSVFTSTSQTDAMQAPAELNGQKIKALKDIRFRAKLPGNATFVSIALSGGSNLGPGKPTATHVDGHVVETAPGPIAGGSTFQLPKGTLQLKAGASGVMERRVGGTSYDDPGLTFTAEVKVLLLTVDVPVACYPKPSPVTHRITIR
ncbi:hypothetical protein [Allokutzneria sp. NRRL B-24872]|uniref:hypothetical protein n=1 Tax=Allokutzneria sp. NRRL B-24872 TaxID=1137961 RepID=UPI000A363E1C|nr:hypothetical protein [Allokutzneria sp. NRRL B-24872]